MTATYTNGNLRASTRSLGKPSASYPGAVATDAKLAIAVDRQQTTLAVAMGITDTSMTVASTAQIVTWCLLSIDNEIVQVNGPAVGNAVPITRGFDGTTAAIHISGAAVSGLVDAYHHNTLVSEVEAIENALGPNLSHLPSSPFAISGSFNFAAQSPGGTLITGTNSVLLSPVPQGVNGTDQNHYLYISGGTGAAEAVKIIGGTAVAGAPSGTVFVTCANAHTGAWTIATATAGMAEAVQSLITAGTGGTVMVPAGNNDVHAWTTIPWQIAVHGVNQHGTIIRNFATTTGVFWLDPFTGGGGDFNRSCAIGDLTIISTSFTSVTVDVQADAVYLYGTGQMSYVRHVTIRNHNIGIHIAGSTYTVVEDFSIHIFGKAGIFNEYGDGNFIHFGNISNSGNTSTPPTLAGGLWLQKYSGIYIVDVDVTACQHGVIIQPAVSTDSCLYGFFTSVLADTSAGHGWYINAANGGLIAVNQFVDCWSSFSGNVGGSFTSAARGVYLYGPDNTNPYGFTWLGGRVRFNGGNGMELDGGSWHRVSGASIGSNGMYTAAPGISFGAVQHVLIEGNQIGNGASGPGGTAQQWGILVGGPPSSDYCIIKNNDLTQNTSGAMGFLSPFAAAAHVTISGNLGADEVWQTYASAASIAVLPGYPVYKITGTVAIATITGGWSGLVIQLVFTDPAPGGLTTGGNIARATTAAQNQILTCTFDGTTWYAK